MWYLVSVELVNGKTKDEEFVRAEVRQHLRGLSVDGLKDLCAHLPPFFDSAHRRALLGRDAFCLVLAHLTAAAGAETVAAFFLHNNSPSSSTKLFI